MYYYEVTIYLVGTTDNIKFDIDENQIHSFLKFITDHVKELHIINVIRHTIQ